jgi:SDR family mycofactocin-dependent oxidoreductase
MGRVSDKVALITGAGKGQGRAHAVRLAEEGADLVLVDICRQIDSVAYPLATPDDLDQTARQVEALGRRAVTGVADVRDQAALDAVVKQAIAELGKIDLVVANAGIWTLARFWELTDEQWEDSTAVNLTGVWRTAKAVAPHMIERREGAMVLISSSNGYEAGANCAHYTAAKHGVIGLMRTIALELAPYGVRCNVVCPGAMNTDMLRWQGAYDMMAGHPGASADQLDRAGHHWTALAHHGLLEPSETTSQAVLWLLSDEAKAVTGTVLPVDGGHNVLPGLNPSPVF